MTMQLRDLIDRLEPHSSKESFGDDIDAAHRALFSSGATVDEAVLTFSQWAAKYQPCLFGRLGAKKTKGVDYDICWLDSADIDKGDLHLIHKIQASRRTWKERAACGLASGYLIMFCDRRLAYAKPGETLLDVCQKIAELYIIEHAPLERDTIYTEAIPLKRQEGYGLFKAGIDIFYPGAHRTLNHESASWHGVEHDCDKLALRCPLSHRPAHVPENYSGRLYSALYHTDVLLPTAVTVRGDLDPDPATAEVWPWLVMDYISDAKAPVDHVNYGLFHPHPITEEARYHNPWPPRRAHNSPLFDY